jgi:hypothetical protein
MGAPVRARASRHRSDERGPSGQTLLDVMFPG